MNRRVLARHLSIGVGCGVLGILLTVFGIHVEATDSFVDFRIVPPVIAALFTGPLAGVVAGVVAALGRLALPLFGIGAGAWLGSSVGTLAAALMAVAARKWIFGGEKPAFVPAALCAVVCELMEMAGVLAFGFGNIDGSLQVLGAAIAVQCLGAVALTTIASFAFRAQQTLKANLFAVLVFGFVGGSAVAVWFTQNRLALALVSETMSSIEGDAVVAIDYPIEPEMLRVAHQASDRWKTAAEMAKADLPAFARSIGYDFVAVVGGDGRVLAASDPKSVGFALDGDGNLKEFLSLNDDSDSSRYGAQPFRKVEGFPAACRGRSCKFVAMRFPEGRGFILFAESFEGYVERDYLFEAAMQDWHVGKNGSLMLIDPESKTVISGMEREYTGKTIDEVGITTLVPLSQGNLLEGTILGQRALVRRKTLEFVPLDVCIIIPYSDVMYQRDLSTVLTAIMASLLFVFVSIFMAKIIRQGRDIAELRRREDVKRQKDMDLAKSIQTSSLERNFPDGIHAIMRTAREVGGDFYDCFECAPGKLMLVIADVSGKGIPASLFMMRSRTEFRAVSRDLDDIAEIMGEVNSRLCKNNDAEMFVTAWIGRLDLATGGIEWVSAGHNPPYVVRADGKIEQVMGKRSLVLAGYDGIKYYANSLKLEKGDRLFLYTDGVTEAQSRTGDFYGEGRLESVLATASGTSAEVCRAVLGSVDAFSAGAPQADDITMMAVTFGL